MYIDLVILAILLMYIITGLRMGFFVEFITIFGVIGNFYLTGRFTPMILEVVGEKLGKDNYLLVYVTSFISLYLFLMIFTSLLNAFFKSQDKGILTRFGGGVISGIKGILVILVLITGYNFMVKKNPDFKKIGEKSIVLERYDEWIHIFYEYVPEEVKTKIDEMKKNRMIEQYIKKIF
ncbi:MAG: CvpA family protein [Fusobacteriaceae bacterium]